MTAKTPKKTTSSIRAGSAINREAASIAASVGAQEAKKRIINIWPEWSDADVNAEKWDVAHRGTKNQEKGKSPVVQHFFDDPDGKIELPPGQKVNHWSRPQDVIVEKTPTIVEDENKFDLMSSNEHVHESELMRWITSQIQALWKQSETSAPGGNTPVDLPADGEPTHSWRPWEHIYAFSKITKAPNIPQYNPSGKYVVKLYWMGCWRKIIIDDQLPYDEQDRLLLPATTLRHELWPMLLTKALIKVASLEYRETHEDCYYGGSTNCEFGDFSVIQCLTGWLPEAIPLQSGHAREIWELLKGSVKEFTLPEAKPLTPTDRNSVDPTIMQDGHVGEKPDKEKEKSAEKPDGKGKDVKDKVKDKGKDDKKDKKDKDKERNNSVFAVIHASTKMRKFRHVEEEKVIVPEEASIPEHPEVVVFASYSGPPKYPVRISVLGEMADSSERLRQSGFSHLYPHPVMIMQTRSCPLEPPPPPEVLPAWKLIRPRKKRVTPSDEAIEPVEEKHIQCVQLTSTFLNYKVSPVPIPTNTHRPKSAIERGSTRQNSRPGTANVATVEESDENAPDPALLQVPPPAPKVEEAEPVKVEEPAMKPEESTPKTPTKKRSVKSGNKHRQESSAQEPSPKVSKTQQPKSAAKRSGSSMSRDTSNAKVKDELKLKDSKDAHKDPKALVKEDLEHQGTPSTDGQETGEEGVEQADPPAESTPTPQVTKADDVWMDFDNFCKCFKTLFVYHKPATYPCNYKHSDLKTASTSAPSGVGKEKKSAPNTAAGPTDDKSPSYLFVDSLKPTEIIVSFAALSRWNDPPPPPPKEESKTALKGKDKASDRDSKAEQMTVESSSVTEGVCESRPPEPLKPGLLVAEPHSWKSLVAGQPVMRLRTTSTKAAVLSLPEGRYLLKFSMSAPLGYHIHLCSSTQFVFGDEEKVMEQLTKESCRFVDNAVQTMISLGKCVTGFSDAVLFSQAWEEYYNNHCPYRKDKHSSKIHHHKVYNEALYQMLKKVLTEANLATPEMAFAWRTFNFDVTSPNILGLHYGSTSRPATGVTTSDRGSATGKKGVGKKRDFEPKDKDPWKNREATPEEHVACIKIQRNWRATYVRKVKAARTPGTEVNIKVQETLIKAWAVLEPSLEQNGLTLFRSMFKVDPDLMTKYPFYKDEWNKIAYADYAGNFPEQPSNTWFVVFREIFYVTEEMLCVPKLHVPIHTCLLRVINNDDGLEIPRVFQKVAPYFYKKNKHGYTFIAEARSLEQPIPAGRWRIRLIGSLSPLPAPVKNEVNSSFHVRELRDYYIPNEKNIILRYSVKVQDDHLSSVQLTTSKSDVYIKLQVLDRDVEVMATVGKGHVVLPAFVFHRDAQGDDDNRRAMSRASKGKGSRENLVKRRINSGRSRSSHSRLSISSLEDEEDRPHKYVIQAQVLRGSWPLSESHWAFVTLLKEMEKNEIKLSYKERVPSPARSEKQQPAAAKGAAGKEKPGKGKAKEKEKSSRPPSQQFDITKPNWTLRVVSDSALVDDIEVRKDTERADEIRAMKKAWEDAEPGRAAKAHQSRLQYLNTHMVTVKHDEEETVEEKPAEMDTQTSVVETVPSPVPPVNLDHVESDTVLTLQPPPPPPPKEILPLIDLTPFLRNTEKTPRLLDEEEAQRQLEEKQKEIAEFRARREEVEKRRQMEKIQRNLLKKQQLEACERMQAALDQAREAINNPREAFRQKFLEAERKRLEEIAAQEAALRAEQEKPASPKGRKSAKGGKKTPEKKKK